MMKRIYLIFNHKVLNEMIRVEALTNLIKMWEVKQTAEMDKGLLTLLELFGNPFDQIETYEW